jgi:hypothetical protein
MELQMNGVPQVFTIAAQVEEVARTDESSDTCASCLDDEDAAFPLVLFESSKPLFDLGMTTWFRLLAVGTNAEE